jgi:hypothetical protein
MTWRLEPSPRRCVVFFIPLDSRPLAAITERRRERRCCRPAPLSLLASRRSSAATIEARSAASFSALIIAADDEALPGQHYRLGLTTSPRPPAAPFCLALLRRSPLRRFLSPCSRNGLRLASRDAERGGFFVPSTFNQDQEDEAAWLGGTLLLPRPALLWMRRRSLGRAAREDSCGPA